MLRSQLVTLGCMRWHSVAGTYEVHEDTLSLWRRQEAIPALVQTTVNYLKQTETI